MNHNIHQAQSHEILRSWQSQRYDISHHKDFVLPMFIGNDDDAVEAIDSMPEVNRYGVNRALEYLEPLVYSYGLRAVLLFPVATKSDKALISAASEPDLQSIASEDEDEDEQEFAADRRRSFSQARSSSSLSLSSSSAGSSSSSSSSNSAGELREGRPPPGSELLLEQDQESPSQNEAAAQASSQNPFLAANEESTSLLGGEQTGWSSQPPAARLAKVTSNKTKTQDVRLIKGMALKDKYNPVLRLIPELRAKFPNLLIICDVCLCAFTSTGHCCLFDDHNKLLGATGETSAGSQRFPISNKSTCHYLAMLSVEYARRGCDMVAPSDMMDGRIQTIREQLNENGLKHVSILSYSAKFASAFYGPFRQATDNAPAFGDRRAYQLPPGSRALALKAVKRDIAEGADFVMVKPGGPYLDIVRAIHLEHPEVPVAVYQVSGEYSMLKIAAQAGIIDIRLAVREMLTAFRRAGATIIISYFTPQLLRGEFSINGD